jgi:hypothetical protein
VQIDIAIRRRRASRRGDPLRHPGDRDAMPVGAFKFASADLVEEGGALELAGAQRVLQRRPALRVLRRRRRPALPRARLRALRLQSDASRDISHSNTTPACPAVGTPAAVSPHCSFPFLWFCESRTSLVGTFWIIRNRRRNRCTLSAF